MSTLVLTASTSSTISRTTSSSTSKNDKELCCICLDEIDLAQEIITKKCNHHYHEDCLNNWLKTKNICPLCRQEEPLKSNQTSNPQIEISHTPLNSNQNPNSQIEVPYIPLHVRIKQVFSSIINSILG